ncbi:cell elongation protein diminuto [Curvularia clavata]|uniref:Cell elongation protein diminuto n=1 Tax=Curvularia clavata TaxID=95742 RepID=A0A9Q9DYJ1_CURCL|nr:cell elongation protein diminuto [Curvularia clavata]
MARLSGLPSEHHHEGPGDAPRRKRGRPSMKNQTPSEDMSSTGKRTASPSGELSQTKRAKRITVDEDEDQIAQEIQESFSRSQQSDTINVDTQTIHTTRRRGRRHSEPLVPAVDDDDDVDELMSPEASTQPLPGLTPHLDRVGAARRRFVNVRRSRMSMPAQLHVERVDEIDEHNGNRVQFAPLTQVLDSRARRRLRRSHLSQEVNSFEDHQKKDKKLFLELRRQLREQDEKIKDLEYRLEARRLGEIDLSDAHADELQVQLDEARQQIDELRASSLYNGGDNDTEPVTFSDDDEDALVMVDPEDLHMSQDLDMEPLPNGKYTSRALEISSQMTLESLPTLSQLNRDYLTEGEEVMMDKIEDEAIERYERELQQLSKALGESQGALRLITIELQNLRFVEAGASSSEILAELRHGFEDLRAEVEKFFPGTTSGITTQQLLQKIPELFGGLFFELKEKLTLLNASQKTEVLLRRQYEGVLDLLGESEERIKQLESDVFTLDRANEDKQRNILELEERNANLTALNDEQEAQLTKQDADIVALEDEKAIHLHRLAQLEEALEKFRQDLDNVTTAATEFEATHHETIARMEKEHADAMADLEDMRAAEQEGREIAEADVAQKNAHIQELEESIERMEADVDKITTDMSTLRERLATQIAARETAENERDEQIELVYKHANTIENLTDTVTELKEQLNDYRENLAAERTQREKTEADLEEANEKIEDLNNRLRDTGIQANELRSKLFQLQQEKETVIAELEEEAEERENELNNQLEAESQERENAEKTIGELEQQILQLEGDLSTLESNLTDMTEARNQLEEDRDVQVANLGTQLADLTNKYAALENSTNSTIASLQANIIDLNNQVQRQQAEIEDLVEQVAEKERVYLEDTTALQEKIDVLEEDLANQKADNESYRKENDSLSRRVEAEANELLNIVGAHNDQVNSLNSVIKSHEATIKNLQDASAKRATEYEEMLEDRNNEITELRLVGDARVETIVLLEAQIEEMKERFRLAEQDTRATIDALTASQRQLQEQNERLADDLKRRNQEALQAVQEMKLKRIEVKTQGVDLHRVVAGKVSKTSEKVKIGKKGKKKSSRRQWDSGFGVDENVEDDERNGEEELIAA